MSGNLLKNKYFTKLAQNDEWEDFTTKFDGLKILKIEGVGKKGKPTNIYTAQWLTSPTQAEDYMVGTLDEQGNPYIIRENVDISVTFIIARKYATDAIDVREMHDAFIDYMTGGRIWVKTSYQDEQVPCVCLEAYEPTIEKLKRGIQSYIMGTIHLHTLDKPQNTITSVLIIGFGKETLDPDEITSLTNIQYYDEQSAQAEYTIRCINTAYLWICSKVGIDGAVSSDFEVPLQDVQRIGSYYCYRTYHELKPHTMKFGLETT